MMCITLISPSSWAPLDRDSFSDFLTSALCYVFTIAVPLENIYHFMVTYLVLLPSPRTSETTVLLFIFSFTFF
jgi:hypothetical protein